MVASAIAEAYVDLKPNVVGIQAAVRKMAGGAAQDLAELFSEGIAKGANAGTKKMEGLLASSIKSSTNGLGAALEKQIGSVSGQGLGADVAKPLLKATEKAAGEGSSKGVKEGLTGGVKAAGPAMLSALAAIGLGAAISGALQGSKGEAKMKATLALDPASAKKAAEAANNLFAGNYGDSLGDTQAATTSALSSIKGLRTASTAEIEEITKRALNMNAAFEVDTARSTQVAGQLMTNFGITGVEAMDLLSGAMGKVPASVREDILDAADEYAPFMKMVGYSATEMGDLLVAASAKGMYGIDKTGDALKEFGIRATDMSTASAVGYETIGLSQEEMTAQLLAGGDTAKNAFKKIITGLKGVKDPTKQAAASLALFGTPLEDLGVNEIPAFLDTLANVPSALGDVSAAAKQLDTDLGTTAGAAFDKFKRSAQIAFTEAALPLITEFQPMLEKGIAWLSANKDEISSFARSMASSFTAVVVPALQVALPFIKNLGDFLTQNKDVIQQSMPLILTLAGVIGGLSIASSVLGPIASLTSMLWAAVPAFAGATAGATVFGLSILPFTLLAAAVFGLGYAIGTVLYNLVTDFEGTTAGAMNLAKGIGNALMGIAGTMVNALFDMINALPNLLNGMIGTANGILSKLNMGTIPTLPTVQLVAPLGDLPKMATGGDIMAETAVIAGEDEPETIVNRGKMNALMDDILAGNVGQSNGGITVENNITIERGAADDDQSLADKVAAATAVAVGAAWVQRRA